MLLIGKTEAVYQLSSEKDFTIAPTQPVQQYVPGGKLAKVLTQNWERMYIITHPIMHPTISRQPNSSSLQEEVEAVTIR